MDSLGQLNIDGRLASSSSGSSTTSRDSARSEPDTPIPAPPPLTRPSSAVTRPSSAVVVQQQRYVRRPTELPLIPDTIHRPPPVQPGTTQCRLPHGVSSAAVAGCCRRIARRRMRDDVTSVGRHPVWSGSSLRLPPLPSPAEMAYLRSVSGGVASRSSHDSHEPTTDCSSSVSTRGTSAGTVPTAESYPPAPGGHAVEESAAEDSSKYHHHQQHQQQVQRVYGCSVMQCGKLYSKSSHLKAHMRSHTGLYAPRIQLTPWITVKNGLGVHFNPTPL